VRLHRLPQMPVKEFLVCLVWVYVGEGHVFIREMSVVFFCFFFCVCGGEALGVGWKCSLASSFV